MDNAVIQQIRRRISRSRFGTVFFVSSFPKFDVEYVTKLLAQFEKEGLIHRVSKGIYVKAKNTKFGLLYPSADKLVYEIAKRDRAKVIPTGATAANRLGFSTQVPMRICYLTSGSARKLILGNQIVTLRHSAPKNFSYRGRLMPELVQALKNIGEKNITSEYEAIIRQLFAKFPENETIDHDLLLAPVWMRQLIIKNRKGLTR